MEQEKVNYMPILLMIAYAVNYVWKQEYTETRKKEGNY